MKVRVTLMTENDKHVDERVSDEIALLHNIYSNESISVEKVEVVER